MLGWLGFAAKVMEFVLTKAAGRTIDLSLDRKHRASKALVRFYGTLEESSVLLDTLLVIFDTAIKRQKPVSFSKDLVLFENQIVRLTEDVARQYRELISTIYIFDPELACLLCSVEGFKSDSLTAFGVLLRKARFTIEFDGLHPFKRISFTTFRDEVANIDLNEIIEASRTDTRGPALIPSRKPNRFFVGRKPNKLVEALSVLLVEDKFTASDFEKLKYLRDRLKLQASLLKCVLPKLREFIASNFTIADVLGHHKPGTRAIDLDLTGMLD